MNIEQETTFSHEWDKRSGLVIITDMTRDRCVMYRDDVIATVEAVLAAPKEIKFEWMPWEDGVSVCYVNDQLIGEVSKNIHGNWVAETEIHSNSAVGMAEHDIESEARSAVELAFREWYEGVGK